MGAKKQTIGYHYLMSLLSGLWRGPLNEIVAIKVGDKVAWQGSVSDDSVQYINQPNLFGGEKKEGGIQGAFRVFMGAPTQVLPGAAAYNLGKPVGARTLPNVKTAIGGLVSDFRGVVTVWYDGLVTSMNPYPKEWKYRGRRSTAGWYNDDPWYPAKAKINLGGDIGSWSDPLDYADTAALLSAWVETPASGYTWSLATHPINGTPAIKVFAPSGTSGTLNTKLTHTVSGLIPGESYTYHRDLYVAGYSTIGSGWHRDFDPRTLVADGAGQIYPDVYANQTGTMPSDVIYYYDNIYVEGAGNAPIVAMNPSHIIYESVTNPEWGRGLDPDLIDEHSFIYSANTFCSELFGLCITWYRKDEIDQFIQSILDHVGAALYTDRQTGLLTLRPIRADYDPDALPLFTLDSGLIDIQEDDSGSSDTAFSEVIVTGHDPISDTDFQMRAQNTAAWQETGAANTLAVEYKGLPTPSLAARVAARELKVHAAGLKKFKVVLDRRAWKIAPASCFRVYAPHRNIGNIILRAGEITDEGIGSGGNITIKAVEDVFGMPQTSFITPVTSTWTPPSAEALPASDEQLIEAGYRDIYVAKGQSDADSMTGEESAILQVASAPSVSSLEYDLYTKAEGEADYENRAVGYFTGTATLTADIGPLDTDINLENIVDISASNEGEALLLGDEIVELVTIDAVTGDATIKRGCADTIPAEHLTGARVWTVDDDAVGDGRIYNAGETVYAKVITRTSSDALTLAEAAEQSIDLVGRAARPFPPGDLKVDGVSVYALDSFYPEPTFTFAHRDRKLQADHLVGHTEASVGPEAGTTYNIRFFDETGVTLIHEETGIMDGPWQFTSAMQAPYGVIARSVVEVTSERDGLESYQKYRFILVLHPGWDDLWGDNWGGGA